MGTGADQPATKADLQRLDAKIDGVEQRLDAKIDTVARQVAILTSDMATVKGDLAAVKGDLGTVKQVVASLRIQVASVGDQVAQHINAAFEHLADLMRPVDDKAKGRWTGPPPRRFASTSTSPTTPATFNQTDRMGS